MKLKSFLFSIVLILLLEIYCAKAQTGLWYLVDLSADNSATINTALQNNSNVSLLPG